MDGNEARLACGAIGAYAAYRATNAARHVGGFAVEDGERALQQAIREAISGDAGAEAAVNNVFSVAFAQRRCRARLR